MTLSRLASQQVARTVNPAIAAAPVAQPDVDDRFDLLTKYIPTETLTLYVAAMAAAPAIAGVSRDRIGPIHLYLAGAVLTPLILGFATYGKQRASGSTDPFRPHPWPYAAALIAYLVWALSVPGLLEDPNGLVLAGFGALLVSTLLALVEPVFGPR